MCAHMCKCVVCVCVCVVCVVCVCVVCVCSVCVVCVYVCACNNQCYNIRNVYSTGTELPCSSGKLAGHHSRSVTRVHCFIDNNRLIGRQSI